MEIKITKLTDWNLVLNLARNTVNKGDVATEPSDQFKNDILSAEHSPIRALLFRIDMIDIPYWVSVHFVRHHIGVEHFVSTQRTDRTGEDRTVKTQDAPVNHTMIINAQELMFMARRRLCGQASAETRKVMVAIVNAMQSVDTLLSTYLVPMCAYRCGICHEKNCCGLNEIYG